MSPASSMIRAQTSDAERRIADIRRFNRFYTQKIGVLQEGLLDSAYALAEVRVLYELAHWRDEADREATTPSPSASRLAARLGLDEGYLSRLLRGFEKQRLIVRQPSADDGREQILSLTPRGRKAFAPLELRSRQQVAAMLAPLSDLERSRLAAAMTTIATACSTPKSMVMTSISRRWSPKLRRISCRHSMSSANAAGSPSEAVRSWAASFW
jgi:DNA-binding MarR family transcriptional regulator